MIEFIKRHWLAYVIGAALAVALGLGAAYVVGVIGSTPDDVVQEQTDGTDAAASEGTADASTSEDGAASSGA